MTLWGGAFNLPADESLRRLSDSINFDRRMYAEDITGSIAYAGALARAGVISFAEADAIVDGLGRVLEEFKSGQFEYKAGDEDIHTAVERRLTELIGETAGKLHTGRSRNDQVATDLRLWVMRAIDQLDSQLGELQTALIEQAEPHIETLMPGHTHFQPAQPITAAHWLMSYFWMLARDRERLADCRRRTSVSPLGSGALAGHPFGIDRERLAAEMGFASCSQNSLDAVSDRDFAAEALFCCALIGVHLSRLGEEIVIYSNPAFGFITLDDRYSTGSSIMPQKRNPDPAEMTRGKAGRLIGGLAGLLAVLKGLPSGYNKDYQEDKEPVFEAFDTLGLLLPVMTAMIETLHLNPERMRTALNETMLATDLADYLVRKGLPFRQAHHVAGRVVREAAESNLPLSQLSLERLRELSPLFAQDFVLVFNYRASVELRDAAGGTAPDAVRRQIDAARAWLNAR